MKRGKSMRGVAVLLSAILMSCGIGPITVLAGKTSVVVDNSSFADEISATEWSNPDGDAYAEKGVIIFPEDSSRETRLITNAFATDRQELEEMFHATTTLKFTQLPENERFAFAFGLQSVESYQGEVGNVEVAFTNNGGIKVEVIAYNDAGEAVTVAEAEKCGSLKSNITIDVGVAPGGKLTLKVAGKKICENTQLPVSGEGSIGFVQTGNCGARISDVNIVVYQYDAPENCDIDENFDKGTLNTGLFTSKTLVATNYYPQSLSVEEYKGNNVLLFERCGMGYVGTTHQYSNFEMTFDVPYLQRTWVFDENDDILEPMSSRFIVSFGGALMDWDTSGYNEAAEAIRFETDSIVQNMKREYRGIDENHLFFAEENDRGFSVKISVVDAVVTVGLKWLDEKEYSTVLTYTLKQGTPTGYIHLWSNEIGNFAVDNIKIVNKDKIPNLVEVEYQTQNFERIPDFAYEEAPLVFREEADTSEDTFSWYSVTFYAGIVGVVLLAGGFVTGIILRKKKSKKGDGKDEE